MITIIFGKPRIGKTALLVHYLKQACYNRERNRAMQLTIMGKINSGFNMIKTVPEHCVSANFEIEFRKKGYSRRKVRYINPYRLGFANDEVKTHFSLPFETIGIMEAQRVFNSRNFKDFKEWQSAFYEQHGHLNINILMDCQRYGLIDTNIRDISSFIEVINKEVFYNKNGTFEKVVWETRRFDNVGLVDKYIASGKTDKSTYETVFEIDYDNVFEMYNSTNCEPKFYKGHFDDDYDIKYYDELGSSIQDYKKYLEEFSDEKPKELIKVKK